MAKAGFMCRKCNRRVYPTAIEKVKYLLKNSFLVLYKYVGKYFFKIYLR